jgi:hypothetical protein
MNSENSLFNNKFLKRAPQNTPTQYQKQQFKKFYDNTNASIQETLPKKEYANEVYEKKTIVNIDSEFRDKNFYPLQNYFQTYLGKTFYNVSQVRLVSTEIPNTDQVIKDTPTQLQNNTMYWTNTEDVDINYYSNVSIEENTIGYLDISIVSHNIGSSTVYISIYNSYLSTDTSITHVIDGRYLATVIDNDTLQIRYTDGIPVSAIANVNLYNPIYKIECKPGNYTATTLSEQLQKSFNQVKRRNQTGQYHYFEVTVNLDTDVMSFDSVITKRLGSNPLTSTAGSEIITVNSRSHGLKTGDRVKMINVKAMAGIPAATLGGDFNVNVIDFNTFTYEVNTRATETTDGGGTTVMTGVNAPFRFLLDTQNTLIQYNIGFADENSSKSIRANDPITTKILYIQDAYINGDYITINTGITPHGLESASVIIIESIVNDGNDIFITTDNDHGIEIPQRITIRNTNTQPKLDGVFNVIPTGRRYLIIEGRNVNLAGNYGEILYGGDKVAINGIFTTPKITNISEFFVENTTLTTFDIYFFATNLDPVIPNTAYVGTSQVNVYHPDHHFNSIKMITYYNNDFAKIKTFLPHEKIGSYSEGITIIDGPVNTNTIDITLLNHGLSTSDIITIADSNTDPITDGSYYIQVIDQNTIRCNFIHSYFFTGTATIITGDKVTINMSNSSPKIDGYYPIINRHLLTSISTGTLSCTVTTSTPTPTEPGDIIYISANTIPPINQELTVQTTISPTQFTIIPDQPITSSATSGYIINTTTSLIKTDFEIVLPGTEATFDCRELSAIHYRIESEDPNGDNIGGILLNYINGVPYEINIVDRNNYMIRVDGSYANKNFTGGGNNIVISSEIHGNRSIQSNTDTGETTGNLFRSISLEGENYIYLRIPTLDNLLTNNTNVSNVFAKLLLKESPGLMVFDGFVSNPKIFYEPLSELSTITLEIVDKNGYAFNFNEINYSLTLEITERVEKIKDTGLSSTKMGTVNDIWHE